MQTIGIIGGGAWGTALAQAFALSGKNVLIWAREEEVVSAINTKHENIPFLPGVILHDNVKATGSITEAAKADIFLFVTPTQHTRAILESMKANLSPEKPVVICAKGVEINSGMAENEYGILCQGNTLTLFINGKEVRSLVDSKYLLPEGKVGISVSSFRDAPVIADFFWAKISQP